MGLIMVNQSCQLFGANIDLWTKVFLYVFDFVNKFFIAIIQKIRDCDKGQFSFDTKSLLYKINEISNLSSKYCYIRI